MSRRYLDADELILKLKYLPQCGGDVLLRNVLTLVEATSIADVVPTADVFEEVEHFRDELMDLFLDLCRGNDFNKLTLFKIGCAVDEIYDMRMAELEKKYKGDINV